MSDRSSVLLELPPTHEGRGVEPGPKAPGRYLAQAGGWGTPTNESVVIYIELRVNPNNVEYVQ